MMTNVLSPKGKKMLMVLDAFLPFILFISSPHSIYLKLNITLCPKTCEITFSKKKKSNFFFKHECGLSNYNFKNATNLG